MTKREQVYIEREIEAEFVRQLDEFPVVSVLGPRQAGKTTMVRRALPDYGYVSLEDPDLRNLAEEDPRAFFLRFFYIDNDNDADTYTGLIIDEIQRVPQLLSYIQGIVDDPSMAGRTGQFVLTGSHQLQLREVIGQSLAGRTAVLHLLPLSIHELQNAGIGFTHYAAYIIHGFLPRVYAYQQRPHVAYHAYYQTYVERDVRQLIQLKDLSLFEKCMKLLAGRVGQIMDYNALANAVGVDNKTIKKWLSILEASYIIFKLPPYFNNFGKRVIKSPKYYFTDVGLLASVLGIETTQQLERDPLLGNIFENLIVIEALKCRYNQGRQADLYFFRDSNGNEIDILHTQHRDHLIAIEVKSASTFHSHFKKALTQFHEKTSPLSKRYVVYNGDAVSYSDGTESIHFDAIHTILQQRNT